MLEPIAYAKVTSNMQIRIPKDVQKELNIKEGHYILFYKEEGRIYVEVGVIGRR